MLPRSLRQQTQIHLGVVLSGYLVIWLVGYLVNQITSSTNLDYS